MQIALVVGDVVSTVKDADRVVVLERGRISESGSHAALFARGETYRRLVERQLVTWHPEPACS